MQARTEELSESLQQQTATAEVLKVISRSAFDLHTVLDTLAECAARLCEADIVTIWRPDGAVYRLAATYQATDEQRDYMDGVAHQPGRGSLVGRALLEASVVHIHDTLEDSEYLMDVSKLREFRTQLGVPFLREGVPIGVIALIRRAVRPFTDKQIELATTFADQAVIAIENVRLFDEVQARTAELQESLEQQTATSEILRIISASPGKLEPVFDAILTSARELCAAEFGHLLLFDGKAWRAAALHNVPEAYARFWDEAPVMAGPETNLGRVQRTGHPDQVPDVLQGEGYLARNPFAIATAELGKARSLLSVPLLKEGGVIGAIALYRAEVRPFNERQIAMLQNFADQAVIAIENARLFEAEQTRTRELQESLEYQTATSDVLNAISRAPAQLQPVFDAIVETAARLCQAEYALVYTLRDGEYRVSATNNAEEEFVLYARQHPLVPGRGSLIGRTALEGRTIHMPDCLADPEYTVLEYQRIGKYRSTLGVPLMRDGLTIGVIALMRSVVRPFTEKQIELVETFADQAVIAIENVRLFEEVQARTAELQESLEYQTATSDVLNVISRSPSELQPVLDAILETAARLCSAEYAFIARWRTAPAVSPRRTTWNSRISSSSRATPFR